MSDSDGFIEDDSGGSDSDIVETAKKSKKRKSDDDDAPTKKKKKKKSSKPSWIDDAAEESGEEGGDSDDEEEEDEDAPNDYVKDGFVVDEEEEDRPRRKSDDGLEDSDEEDDDDDDDDGRRKKGKLKKKKLRRMDQALDEDDLDLIRENRGEDVAGEKIRLERERREAEARRNKIVAKSEAELRKGLFTGSDDEGDVQARRREAMNKHRRQQVERYDEDGMDDFIDDDIGDQADIMNSDLRGAGAEGRRGGVSEAQMNEASEIFGTDYLEFMANSTGEAQAGNEYDEEERELMGKRASYREKGVGVDLGVDSEEDISDDDDLFDQDEDEEDLPPGVTAGQRAEALKLKRQKRTLAKQERRQKAYKRKMEKRKAQLRKAFEPVQLIENFCTDRDDEIRRLDAPERYYDLVQQQEIEKSRDRFPEEEAPMTEEEQQEATWIMHNIPSIAAEYRTCPPVEEGRDMNEVMEQHQQAMMESVVYALRYMLRDHLEPAFIEHYRADRVAKESVRSSLYEIMDEDAEFERTKLARTKVEILLETVTLDTNKDEAAGSEEEQISQLAKTIEEARAKLDESVKKENTLKAELEEIKQAAEAAEKNDDDDDNLFGADDDDEEEANKKKLEEEEKKKSREKRTADLEEHIETVHSLLETRSEKVSQLENQLQSLQARNAQSLENQRPAQQVTKKICRAALWNTQDYRGYIGTINDVKNIVDVSGYLHLIQEGNDAIRKKELPWSTGTDGKDKKRKRSRRFDRDFYRTCVSEGLRSICYRFLLAPNRVGIKLEDQLTRGGFDFTRTMPGETSGDGEGEAMVDPQKWVATVIPSQSPVEFANELVGSGELVMLSSAGSGADATDSRDPLRGCRYVAAMELAHEPRIRKHLRKIYRRLSCLTTHPTKKGMEFIDAFHDYYGLHLIRNKPIKEHFPMDETESELRKSNLSPAECAELDKEMAKRERQSCLQYLRLMKAEATNDVEVHIHLPLLESPDDWYRPSSSIALNKKKLTSTDNQDISALMTELERVYLPPDGDTDEWNEERRKVLRFTLTNFLLPQFEAEIRRELKDLATKAGVIAAGEELEKMAMEGPYRPSAIAHTENRFLYPTGDQPIVGVCVSTDNREATYLVSLTERGEMGDHLAVPGGTRVDSPKMREKIITFFLQHRPSAVIVGTGGGFSSRFITRKLGDMISEAVNRWNNREIQGEDEDDEAFEVRRKKLDNMVSRDPYGDYDDDDYGMEWKCNSDIIDDSIAQLFGRSVRSKKEFPDQAVNLKIAISIGRYAQDPLSELTYAWGVASDAGVFGTELLYINIHPMQQLLPKPMLLRNFERVLTGVVARVGVDVNTSCQFDHLHGLLGFVPGLGPRKAANLKMNLAPLGGLVTRRKDLLEKRLMGPVVYNNSVAFLRIRDVDQLDDQFLHPLDDTRLHPDVYIRNVWASKIAVDALERDDSAQATEAFRDVMDDSRKEVERLFKDTKAEWESRYGHTFNIPDWNPRKNVPADMWRDKVEELDLEAFANMIEQSGKGRWHSHLQMIKWEFRLPFCDPRKPMEPLSGDKLFRLITGETDQTLRPGKEITGKVVKNGDFGSRLKLEGDIPAFIPLRNLADEHVEAAEDIVNVGTVVTAIVTEVKKDHMVVDMSLKMEDFKKNPGTWDRPPTLPPLDDHFDRGAAHRIEEQKSRDRDARMEALNLSMNSARIDGDGLGKKKINRVARRACAHPAFRNVKQDEVDKEIREAGEMMVGEALIRPSSKSSESLAIHWVVKLGSVKVVEITEEEKDTDASIGNVLKIKNETYGSIDELLGRYIAPMNDYVEELTSHRKFLDLPEDEVDEKLQELKQKNPASIPYHLCWMEMHPGYASLRFVLSKTPRHHPVGISPKGFNWGSQCYSNLDKLLNEFKRNPRGVSTKSSRSSSSPPRNNPAPPPRPSRWGAKPPPPSFGQPPPPAAPAAPAVGGSSGWGAPPPRPPPPTFVQAPPRPPPPTFGQPPPRPPPPPRPTFGRPPPPPTFGRPPPPPTFGQQ
ncbi:Ty 6 homolog [Seminavis robusta]|uniref:Ty 6 homolog n=1 Tax=Seminavis robusta TaxID=568900 RepID=A0A9N8DXJ4_9STRA|nr:Ty 6 homolog [Seminavis robusta]|eukprot:Sro445_g144550.1 Ty 6 homolog (2005) ;mRNA; f:39780-45969